MNSKEKCPQLFHNNLFAEDDLIGTNACISPLYFECQQILSARDNFFDQYEFVCIWQTTTPPQKM